MTAMQDRARLCASSVHMGQRDKAGRDYFAAHVADVVRRLHHNDDALDGGRWW